MLDRVIKIGIRRKTFEFGVKVHWPNLITDLSAAASSTLPWLSCLKVGTLWHHGLQVWPILDLNAEMICTGITLGSCKISSNSQ